MTGDRIAVIDLGSNTFHLLICEVISSSEWIAIHKEREYVKLASGGINIIDEETTQRAIDAMVRFVSLINKYEVSKTRAIATAAMRESENGMAIAKTLSSITGIPIEIIDGRLEAKYILLGIRSALPALKTYGLIMDIGGGSVEFILFKEDHVAFAESFKIGVAVLYSMFHQEDPISEEQKVLLDQFLEKTTRPLLKALSKHPGYYLIGASGSFEVLYDVLLKKESAEHWAELDMDGIMTYMDGVIRASLAKRRTMREIPEERLDYIVVAYLLIEFILKKAPPKRLYYCDYALKEGVIAEMIQ